MIFFVAGFKCFHPFDGFSSLRARIILAGPVALEIRCDIASGTITQRLTHVNYNLLTWLIFHFIYIGIR